MICEIAQHMEIPSNQNEDNVKVDTGLSTKSPKNKWIIFAVLLILLTGVIGGLVFFKKNYLKNTSPVTQPQNNDGISSQPTTQNNIVGTTIVYRKYDDGKIVVHTYDISARQDRVIFSITPILDTQTLETVNSILSGKNTYGETPEQSKARAESLRQDGLERSANIYFGPKKLFYAQSNSDFSKVELRSYDIKSGKEVVIFESAAEKGKTVNLDYSISSDNRVVVLVNSKNPLTEGADEIYGRTYTQKIFTVDLSNQQAKKVKQQVSNTFGGFTPLALIGNFLYLAESSFESNQSLARLNLESGVIEDLSEKLGISFSGYHSRLSPNGQVLAMSTLSSNQGKIVNRISFLNLTIGTLTHSKLISRCNGEFPGGLSCFIDLTWYPDSNSVYVTTEDVNEYGSGQGRTEKAYQITADGNFHDLPFSPNFDLLQIFANNTALAVTADSTRKISSLDIISLDNGSIKEKVLATFSSDNERSLGHNPSFLGVIVP